MEQFFLMGYFYWKNKNILKNSKWFKKKILGWISLFLFWSPQRNNQNIYVFISIFTQACQKTKISWTKSVWDTKHTQWSILSFLGTFYQTYFRFLTGQYEYAYENINILIISLRGSKKKEGNSSKYVFLESFWIFLCFYFFNKNNQ